MFFSILGWLGTIMAGQGILHAMLHGDDDEIIFKPEEYPIAVPEEGYYPGRDDEPVLLDKDDWMKL